MTLEQKLVSMQAEVIALKQENAIHRKESGSLKTTLSRLDDEAPGMNEYALTC